MPTPIVLIFSYPTEMMMQVPIQDTLLKMSLYVSLVLIVPGPTNTLLLSSGLKAGVRGTWPLIVAEALGYVAAISAWGFSLHAFAANYPWFVDMIKLASSVYIFCLALKMWAKSVALQDSSASPVKFRELFIATLANPKALLFAGTMFPSEAFRSTHYFLWSIATFLIVLMPIGVGWTCLGRLLTRQLSLAAHTATLLRGMSLVLLTFSGTLLYSILYR